MNVRVLRTIDRKYIPEYKAIGKCHNKQHKGYLTKNTLKQHECIEKRCHYLEKINDIYWKDRDKQKTAIEKDKLKYKQTIKEKKERNKYIKELLEKAGNIYITAIREEPAVIKIFYIYKDKIDLKKEIIKLGKKFGKTIVLKARIGNKLAIEKLLK